MKIAIDCRMFGKSGIGVFLDNILEYLLSMNPDTFFLLIGECEKLKYFNHFPNCEIFHTDISVFSLGECLKFPVKEINKCDVFYSPNYNIPFGIKIPIIATIHDVVFLDIKGLTSKVGRIIRRLVLWRVIRISHKIITVSEFSRSRIMHYFRKTPEIIVAYNGINKDLKYFLKEVKSPYSFEYILFVGNIKKHKGIDRLIKAYEKLLSKGFNYKLVIVGDYLNFKTADVEVINRIDKHISNIIFTNKLSNKQLYNLIANASLLIQPSLYEGFGIPPMEALYLGRNALISNIPVFLEVYSKLPVTFFCLNNIDDLSEKIMICVNNNLPDNSVRVIIDELYSYKRSAKLIFDQIQSVANEKYSN